MSKRYLPILAVLVLLTATVADAQSLIDPHASGNEAPASGGVSLDQAVAIVQSRFHAKAVKAETVNEDGHYIHFIRLVSADKSRVFTVRVDAATGRIY